MIPAGTYTARAVSGVLSEASTGTIQVVVDFELLSAEVAGQHIVWYGFLTDKTAERTFESLRYAGWVGENIDAPIEFSANAPDVDLVIEHDTYKGETSAKVQWVNRVGGSRAAALPPDQAKVIAAKMRGVLAKVDLGLKAKGMRPPGLDEAPKF